MHAGSRSAKEYALEFETRRKEIPCREQKRRTHEDEPLNAAAS